MKKIRKILNGWILSKDASIGLEYGLLAGGISVLIIASVFIIGNSTNTMWEALNSWLAGRY